MTQLQERPRSLAPEHTVSSDATRRDVQRVALRDLVTLLTDCATTEAEADRRRKTGMEAAGKKLQKLLVTTQQKYDKIRQAIAGKYQDRVSSIQTWFGGEKAGLDSRTATAKKRIEYEHSKTKEEAKKKYDQAIWLAESVLEADQIKARVELKKAHEESEARFQWLNSMEVRAANLLQKYNQPPQLQVSAPATPPPASPEPLAASQSPVAPSEAPEQSPAPASESSEPADSLAPASLESAAIPAPAPAPLLTTDLGAEYAKHHDVIEDRISALANLKSPQFAFGIWPVLLGLMLCLLTAGAVQGYYWLHAGTLEVQIKPLAYAAGSVFLACLILKIVLMVAAKNQIREIYTPLRQSLDSARITAQLQLQQVEQKNTNDLSGAGDRCRAEVKVVRDKLNPPIAKSAQKRDAALAALKSEQDSQLSVLQKKRDAAQSTADRWRDRTTSRVESRCHFQLELANQKRDSDVAVFQSEYDQSLAGLKDRWLGGLSLIQAPIGENGASVHEWDDPAWKTWKPPKKFSSAVRFGQMNIDMIQLANRIPRDGQFQLPLPPAFAAPALLALPRQASMLIQADMTLHDQAVRAQQMLMIRLLTSLPPGRVRFTIMDPVGLGQNFAGFMHLADYDEALVNSRIWTSDEHIEQRLTDLTEHMETVIQKYLRNEFETIDDYNAQAGELAEPYRFLIISDFPVGFAGDSFRRLASIVSTGARCGVYTIIFRDTRYKLPPEVRMDELESHSVNIIQEGDHFIWKDEVFRNFQLKLDGPPTEQFLTDILQVVGREAKETKRVEVPFGHIAPTEAQFWSSKSDSEIAVPMGRCGATRNQVLRLGRGMAQHALLAGKTGSGKSTLLHVMITNLAMWYHPNEVEFYLIDFKKGVEFKTYATHVLPHARAIAVESDREFGLSVLQRLDGELARRGALYRKAGTQDLASFREAMPNVIIPRTLLIVDEFQEFFSEDDKIGQEAALLIDRLVRQGRAFGIHVMLGSQTIGGTSGLSRSTIGQMAVRVALQCSEADSQLILGDNNSAARLLSRPGEAIYNDAGGLVEGNSPFQIAWLSDELRETYLNKVRARAAEVKNDREPPIVFEGNAPADITKNNRLMELFNARDWPANCPAPVAWLGDPVAIKEPTTIVFRRQSGSNAVLVGQQEQAAMAMLVGIILSLTSQHRPKDAIFYVFDGSAVDSPLATVFPAVKAAIPHEVRMVEWRDVGTVINELSEEMQRRQAGDPSNLPSIYVIVYGLQRYRILRKTGDEFSFGRAEEGAKAQPDKIFADLIKEGPALGMHVLLWSDTLVTIDRTLDRNGLREFDNRILFQMSAADSSNLIDSPMGNKLGFYRALTYSEEQGTIEKFRPYALADKALLDEFKAKLAAKT